MPLVRKLSLNKTHFCLHFSGFPRAQHRRLSTPTSHGRPSHFKAGPQIGPRPQAQVHFGQETRPRPRGHLRALRSLQCKIS